MQLFTPIFWLWIISLLTYSINQGTFLLGVKWNKDLKDFELFPGEVAYETEWQKLFLQSQRDELDDLNGEPVQLTYYQELGFFEFYDNDTKATGICGDIWKILSKLLNFTLVIKRSDKSSLGIILDNGSYTGLLEYARLNQTDVIPKLEVHNSRVGAVTFTSGSWSNSFRIFTYGQWSRDQTWLFHLFTHQVWSIIGFFILWLSISSFIMQIVLVHKRGLKLEPLSYVGHLLYTFASVCNQGNVPDNASPASSILMVTTALFSGFVLTGYSSRLLYNMTLEVLAAPFKDLKTLIYNTNLEVVVVNGTMGYLMFTNLRAKEEFRLVRGAKRFKVASNLSDAYYKVCSKTQKYVLFDGMDEVAVRGTAHRDFVCPLVPIGKTYYPTIIASGIGRRFKYKKSLDIGLAKLREFGIIDRIRRHYMSAGDTEFLGEQDNLVKIELGHVSVILEILGIGILLSIVICTAEIFLFAWQKNRSQHRVIRKIPIAK